MLVRPATHADLRAIQRIEQDAFHEESYPPFFFRQALDLWPDLLLAAEAGPSGLAGYALAAPSTAAGEAWMLSDAVDTEHRGHGIAARLIQGLLDRLARRGVSEVRLTVHPENAAAIRLYEKHGFRTDHEEAEYFGSGEPRLLMLRKIGETARTDES